MTYTNHTCLRNPCLDEGKCLDPKIVFEMRKSFDFLLVFVCKSHLKWSDICFYNRLTKASLQLPFTDAFSISIFWSIYSKQVKLNAMRCTNARIGCGNSALNLIILLSMSEDTSGKLVSIITDIYFVIHNRCHAPLRHLFILWHQ